MTEIGSHIRNPKLAIRRFLDPVRAAFTTRPDGSSWARATNTWQIARAYVEGLVRPGSHKTLRGIGKRMDVHEDRVRRFITQSPWEPDALQDHLNHNIPDSIASGVVCVRNECWSPIEPTNSLPPFDFSLYRSSRAPLPSKHCADHSARATNLIQRERKFDVVALFYTLAFGFGAGSERSIQAFFERYVEMTDLSELSTWQLFRTLADWSASS